MANGAPIYTSELRQPGIDMPSVHPAPLPPSGGIEKIGGAITALATTAGEVNKAFQDARDHTEVTEATINFLNGKYALETDYEKRVREGDGYKSAPENFAGDIDGLASDSLGGIRNPRLRERARLEFTRASIASHSRIRHAALNREADANIAGLDAIELDAVREADAARTDVQRGAAITRYGEALIAAQQSGYINAQTRVAREQRFSLSLDRAAVMRVARTDPEAARRMLDDPAQFPSLDPVTRESFKSEASNRADQVRIDRAVQIANDDPDTVRDIIDGIEQPHNRARAQIAVDASRRQHQAAIDQAVKAAASTARASDDVLEIVRTGFDVDPKRVEQVRAANVAAAARGDQAAAKYVRELDTQIELQPFVRRAWQTPYLELDNTIKTLETELTRAGGNAKPEQITALKAFRAVRDEIKGKRESEPIVLGGQSGARYYTLGPIDPAAAPDDPALRAELARRGVHATLAQSVYGGKAVAFTAEEARQFKDRYAAAGPDEQFRMLRTFGETLSGAAYDDTVKAVAGGDAVTGYVGRLAQERPELAREIMQGQALIGAEGVPKDKQQTVTEALRARLGGQLYPSVDEQSAAIEAAKALYVARRGRAGALFEQPDAGALEKAIEEVTGPIVKRNGARTPAPPGMTAAAFSSALDSLDQDGVNSMGGARDSRGMPVSPKMLRDYAILKPFNVGGSRYAVGMPDARSPDGFAPLLTHDFEPLVIDVKDLAARKKVDPKLRRSARPRGQDLESEE